MSNEGDDKFIGSRGPQNQYDERERLRKQVADFDWYKALREYIVPAIQQEPIRVNWQEYETSCLIEGFFRANPNSKITSISCNCRLCGVWC